MSTFMQQIHLAATLPLLASGTIQTTYHTTYNNDQRRAHSTEQSTVYKRATQPTSLAQWTSTASHYHNNRTDRRQSTMSQYMIQQNNRPYTIYTIY